MQGIRAVSQQDDSVAGRGFETLVWTRGADFPIARLDSGMKCPRCGSRRVFVAFEPPSNPEVIAVRRIA